MPNHLPPPDPTRPEPTPSSSETTEPTLDPSELSPDSTEPSPLARRLLRRHTEALGLIDVKHAARHHARLTRWLADRFELLEQLRTRYAVDDDAATPDGHSLLLQRAGAQPITAAGLAPPSPVPPTAPHAFPPPTFIAPPAAEAAALSPTAPPSAAMPSAAASAPVEHTAPPPTTFRVSRDSAARAARRGPKPDASPSDATAESAATPSSAAKPAALPRAAEQTHASRNEPTESPLVMREAARGREPEAREATDDAPPPGVARGVDELELQRPRRAEATTPAANVPSHTDAPTHADAGGTPPTGNVSGAPALPVVRAEARAPQLSQAALPLIAQRETGTPRGETDAGRGEVSTQSAPPTAAGTEANLPRVNERDARAADTHGRTQSPRVVQARPDAELPLASARLPSPDAARAASQPGEEVGVGRGKSGVGLGEPGVGRGEAGMAVSSEVRDGAAAGPPEIVWRKGGGRTPAGVARSADEEHRESHPPTAHSSGARPSPRPGESTVADAAATPTAPAPEVDLGRLTDSVIRAITRRLAVERERRGMRP